MASCSLHMSCYNVSNNHGSSAKFRELAGNQRKSSLNFPPSLSSLSSIAGVWCLHLSRQIHHSVRVLPSTYTAFTCRSFFLHCRGLETPICKATGLAFSWSCNSVRPILFQLVPAAGVVVFALWVLEPVVRFVHFFFFRCDDNDWRKSRTNYIVTSYLQPLMLWTGAVLSCRILDPITLPTEAGQSMKERILIFGKSLSTVLVFSYCLSCLIHQTQKFFMERNDSDIAQNMGFQFAGKAIGSAIWIAAAALFMELLGFSTQKWLTAGGLGTVLLLLILTNFLSSVMIHATRPFLVNEWIQTKFQGYEVSGFVENIVAHMRKVLAKNPHVEQQRLHRRVFLEYINTENQALMILVSCFVKTSHFEEYLCVKEAILLDFLRVISHHRARLATPIRTVQKFYGDTGVENVPFAETMMNMAEARARTARSNEEIDVKLLNSESRATSSECGSQAIQGSRNPKGTDKTDEPPVTNSPPVSVSSEQAKTAAARLDSTVSNRSDGEHISTAFEMPTMPDSKSAAEKVGGNTTSSSHSKFEGEKTSVSSGPTARSALEENIVLGVALDGCRRTLPIEEEDTEQRKLTAFRSGDVSPVKKDERQISAAPGAAAADLKEENR